MLLLMKLKGVNVRATLVSAPMDVPDAGDSNNTMLTAVSCAIPPKDTRNDNTVLASGIPVKAGFNIISG